MGQNVRREPEEALGLADAAQGNLEVGDPPGRLDLMAGRGQAKAHDRLVARPANGPRPVIVQDRVSDRAIKNLEHTLAKRSEEPFLMNREVLVGRLSFPEIELHPDRPRPVRRWPRERESRWPWASHCRRSD